jgi:methylenetetrahydrofolate reductase (NADPH)
METHNFSIEFFPPKTLEGAEKLRVTRRKLAELQPKYFSVTFGAGGSTQQGTLDTVLDIMADGHVAAPAPVLHRRHARVDPRHPAAVPVAGHPPPGGLRGDLPSGYGGAGELRYASELVEFIRAETGDWFHIEVAAYPEVHPQARSPQDDLLPSSARSRPARTPRSPSISTMPTPISSSSTMRENWASRCRSWPASCRSRTTRS